MIALMPQNCCRIASVIPMSNGSLSDLSKTDNCLVECFDAALFIPSNSFLASAEPLIAVRIFSALSFLLMKNNQRGLSGMLISIAIKITDGILIIKNIGLHVSFCRNH